jgi:hypothetical protein
MFYKGRWDIPDDQEIWVKIMESFQDSRVAGYFGQFKTVEQIKKLVSGRKLTIKRMNTFRVD